MLWCLWGVLGLLTPIHRCARSVRCFAGAVCWSAWLLFTGVPALCVVLRVRCPGPLGSCSPVCPPVCCVACAVSWATCFLSTGVRAPSCAFFCAVSWGTWPLFTGVPAQCVVLRVRCPGPLGSCSPVCAPRLVLCFCSVLGHLAPVHRCASSFRCFDGAVSWATWLLFTVVPARCVVFCVRRSGPLGSCSPVCPPGVFCCVCVVLGHLAPVHPCSPSVCCGACGVSWATWLLFTSVRAPSCALLVQCPGPPGSCSSVCPLCLLCCVCGVLGLLTPVHRCARSVRSFAGAVCWAAWLLFTGVPALCVVLRVRCPGPLGSCSPVCPPVCCPACAVSWATWVFFTGVLAWCAVLRVRCPGPVGSCSPVCSLGLLCCVLRVGC